MKMSLSCQCNLIIESFLPKRSPPPAAIQKELTFCIIINEVSGIQQKYNLRYAHSIAIETAFIENQLKSWALSVLRKPEILIVKNYLKSGTHFILHPSLADLAARLT